MSLPKLCTKCNFCLVNNDFYIDGERKCPHANNIYIQFKYKCPSCKYEPGWENNTKTCPICVNGKLLKETAEQEFNKGNFQRIVKINDTCFESLPCQHYLTYVDYKGVTRSKLMFLPNIQKLYENQGLDFEFKH